MVNAASVRHMEFFEDEANQLATNNPAALAWRDSPYNWIHALPSASVGAVGRKLLIDWAISLGFSASRTTVNHQHYVVVNGRRIQVKLSTLWANGMYKFQQIRQQDYEYLFFLGISPHEIHAWLVPREDALINSAGQHTGAGAVETHWVTAYPGQSNGWLDEFGGQLSDVEHALRAM